MLGAALSFVLLMLLPTDFAYPLFAAILLADRLSMGMFASPNRAAMMNSLPTEHRGAGGAMNQTFQNSAQVLSIGIFFTLMIVGLASTLPHTLSAGLEAHGVPAATAQRVGALPPVSILFAAFLGYNPIQSLLGPHTLQRALAAHDQAALTGPDFFPQLISGPFRDGLHTAFAFAIVACLSRPPRRCCAAAASTTARSPSSHDPRSNMHVEWYGQSTFRLRRRRRPSSSTRSATCPRPPRAGCSSTTRRSRA